MPVDEDGTKLNNSLGRFRPGVVAALAVSPKEMGAETAPAPRQASPAVRRKCRLEERLALFLLVKSEYLELSS